MMTQVRAVQFLFSLAGVSIALPTLVCGQSPNPRQASNLQILQVKAFQSGLGLSVVVRVRAIAELDRSSLPKLGQAIKDSMTRVHPAMRTLVIWVYGKNSVGDAGFDIAKAEWGFTPAWKWEYAEPMPPSTVPVGKLAAGNGLPTPQGSALYSRRSESTSTYEGNKATETIETFRLDLPPEAIAAFYWAHLPSRGFLLRRQTGLGLGFCKPGLTGSINVTPKGVKGFAISAHKDPDESCAPD